MEAFAILLAGGLGLGGQIAAPPGEVTPLPAMNPLIVEADEHYRRREEGRVAARASSREITLAIGGYETAAESPESAEARWKLARALYFRGSYTGLEPAPRKAVFEEARRVSEDAIAIVERPAEPRVGKSVAKLAPEERAAALSRDPEAAPAFFWASVAWGQWALATGKVAAAKAGAAEKIRDYAKVVIGIDPTFEEGGGYRILGRLHDQAPWIPFLTGWVSRAEALRNLRLAVSVNARNFVNRHFLAEALARGNRSERTEAIRIERELVADAPDPGHLVEELAIQEEAQRNLTNWSK